MTFIGGAKQFITSGTLTWGSSAANTLKTFTIAEPNATSQFHRYRVTVRNASTVSALTVKAMVRELSPTTGTYSELTRFAIPTAGNGPRTKLVEGWLTGDKTTSGTVARLDVLNDTAVNTSQGFSTFVRIRKY